MSARDTIAQQFGLPVSGVGRVMDAMYVKGGGVIQFKDLKAPLAAVQELVILGHSADDAADFVNAWVKQKGFPIDVAAIADTLSALS